MRLKGEEQQKKFKEGEIIIVNERGRNENKY